MRRSSHVAARSGPSCDDAAVRPDADIVVVGAGIVGVATARALGARAGSVVLLEQFELGHDRGSSHGTSRIFRLNYPDERFVRLAQAADAAWRELEQESGTTLIERVGSLDIGPIAAETGRALAACGVPYETLCAPRSPRGSRCGWRRARPRSSRRTGAHSRRQTWPMRPSSPRRGRWESTCASVLPSASSGWSGAASGLTLEREELTARAVVVTAGAWATGLLAPLEIDLPVVPTTETVVYVDLPDGDRVPR